jgi:hypothetical protein
MKKLKAFFDYIIIVAFALYVCQAKLKCPGEDLNLHGVAPASS